MNSAARAATWFPLGPFGGDARSFATDPVDSRHLFLGTATGWVYDSRDGGEHWHRVAQIARRNDLVIDHIVVDRVDPKRLVVGAWTADHLGDGGIFISEDYGKSWYSQAQMRGQSVRSLARSASDPRELVAGTLKGVFRSTDNGMHWTRISPQGDSALSREIKEVQSIAIDPDDPNVIYAGTWHLPWKTVDGGKTWSNIKDGIIDDSDVFSIIVDPKDPKTVYASACSGIYKSSDAGALFRKVQGIPSTARRTRTLEQDPQNLNTVFAGTTEGLYRTTDAGAHWDRLTPGTMVVNDVYVDPKDDQHVLIATDRGGVYRSEDGGTSFEASNDGFSAQQVVSYASTAQRPEVVYVGVVNGKATGGVFRSSDGGVQWKQQSEGLGGRDVFSLISLDDGSVLAGTSHGIFRLQPQDDTWADSSALQGSATVAKVEAAPRRQTLLPAPTRLTSPGPARHSPKAAAKDKKVVIRRPSALKSHGRKAAGRGQASRHAAVAHPPRHRASLKHTQATAHAARFVLARRTVRPVVVPRKPAARQAEPSASGARANRESADRLDSVVYTLARSGDALFAGTTSGLLRSSDLGQHWSAVASLKMPEVHFISVLTPPTAGPEGGAPMVLVGSLQRLALSADGGATWDTVALPADLTQIGAATIDGDKNLWVGGREGVWLSTDYGATWKTLHNLYLTEVDNLYFDQAGKRVLATTATSPVAFSVSLPDHKVSYWDTGWKLRFVRPAGDHLIGATLFDGVVVQPKMVASPEAAVSTAGK